MSSSIRIVDMPDLGAVTDNSSVVGEHAGLGRFGVQALRSYFVGPDSVNVKSFGAAGNGTTDDTSAINNALASGMAVYLPAGTYLVSNALNITRMGQRVYGDGAAGTIITVPATFNMTARGVFAIEANYGDTFQTSTTPGPVIEDLTIQFAQVDTAVKANLIQFPPAIYITNTLRWRVERVRLMRGWNGIYAYANTLASGQQNTVGGGYIYDLQSGCLNTNIYIDGSSDTLRINNAHFWPFGLTTNQQVIFGDPTLTVGIQIARADDFKITNGLCFVGLGIRLTKSANGGNYGNINDVDFDFYSGMEVLDGHCTLTNCLFLVGASKTGLSLLGNAKVTASALSFSAQSPGAQAIICFPPTGTAAELVLGDFDIGLATSDFPAVHINSNASPGTSVVTLSNGQFQVDPTVARVNAVVLCQSNSATLVMSGCQVTPKAAGGPGGLFVQITDNGTSHRLSGNSAPGWPIAVPVGCAYEYPNFYQQVGGAADLNAAPIAWSGFGLRSYIGAASQANWPPNSGPHLAVLDTYTANTTWSVQMSFGYLTDGLWYRAQNAGTWGSWYQIVTTLGGMRMHADLDFDNNTGVRFFDAAGTGAVSLLLSSGNTLFLNGINAAGAARSIASMVQVSDTSPFQFVSDVQLMNGVGFHAAAPIAKPTVSGSRGGNAALASLLTALATYGLVTDSTSA